MSPDEGGLGCAISSHGAHAAVLAVKGSRFVVLIDGVEGPRIEELLSSIQGAPVSGGYWIGQVPILFSDGGEHCAYVAKSGDDYIIMLDGKEAGRGPISTGGQITLPLTFSRGGRHFFYMNQDDAGKYHIVADGQPGPACYIPMQLVISPDGEHYAYVGYEHDRAQTKWGVVDGRQVNFFGEELQFTGRNVLVSKMSGDGANILVLNGKPEIKAYQLSPMWISPDGRQIAIVVTPRSGDPSEFTVNGKVVPDTQGLRVDSLYFSADGKRYAALCETRTGSKFMIVDGKRGEEYQDIPNSLIPDTQAHWRFTTANDQVTVASMQPVTPAFTADSSKFVYLAKQGARSFLVVDGQESNGFGNVISLMLSSTGSRVGMLAVAPDGKQHVLVDDKDQTLTSFQAAGAQRISCLTFSPGLAHYAYLYGQRICLDGVAQPGVINGASYVFSPDDQHLAYPAELADRGCFIMDGKVVAEDVYSVNYAFFSPDSRHLYWVSSWNLRAQGTKDAHMLCVDGKPAAHYSEAGGGLPVNFEFSADGVLTFVALKDGKLVRFRVTPSADANVGTMLAAAPVAKDK
ncbi:MAG: hypothetical protein ABSA67_12590 [Candidatus Brocadiia bacterium]